MSRCWTKWGAQDSHLLSAARRVWGDRPDGSRAHSKEGSSAARWNSQPSARPSRRLDPVLDSSLIQASDPPLVYAVAANVRAASGAQGVLIAGFAARPREGSRMVWSAESYAAVIALCLDDQGALNELIAAGPRDVLTGCLTYEATIRELDREINRSARGGLHLSVCFIDLDDFKHINDRYGHLCGNEVLARIGQILRDGVRSCDSVGRVHRDPAPDQRDGSRGDSARGLRTRRSRDRGNLTSPESDVADEVA